jgi:hypothetical protein
MSDTEQIPTITDKPKRVYKPRVKKVQPEPEPVHGQEPVQEPVQEPPMVKPKRERTEKQILAFKKMQEKRKEQDELKKLNKTIEKDKQIHDNHSTKIQKLKDKIISNASAIIQDDEEDEEPVKPAPKEVALRRPAARKPRIKNPVMDEDESPVSLPRQVSNDVKYIFV